MMFCRPFSFPCNAFNDWTVALGVAVMRPSKGHALMCVCCNCLLQSYCNLFQVVNSNQSISKMLAPPDLHFNASFSNPMTAAHSVMHFGA